MTPLLEQFLSESRDFLQGISEKLMALEKAPDDAHLMTELFRYVHTLKGNSGLFDFPEMTRVLHAGEDLMDAVRNGQIAYSQTLADRLLDAMDFVSVLCDEIEETEAIGATHAANSARLTESLRQLMAVQSLSAAEAEVTAASDASGPASVGLDALPAAMPASVHAQVKQLLATTQTVYFVRYTPLESCFFTGEDPFHQARTTPDLLWGQVTSTEAWPPLTELDAYKCVLQFTLLTHAPLEQLHEHYRYSAEQVDIQAVTPVAEPLSASDTAEDAQTQAVWLALLETQQQVLLAQHDATWKPGIVEAVVAALTGCLQLAGADALGPMQAAASAAVEATHVYPLQQWLEGYIRAVKTQAPVAATAETQALPGSLADPDGRASRRNDEGAAIPKSVKVDQEKIDRLMGLIGEMVVAKNALPYLAGRAESVFGVRELSREIKLHYSVINRIAEEMQDAIMQVRMMPVSFVFQRFPRLVRDISRKLGKEINLVLEGEDTEADKNIIESLGDPLVHIVRNSLDHGFELPEQRKQLGKPVTGTLTISAKHASDRVFIEISDDGKGIDPEVVKLKAYQKGLISQTELETISDQAAQNLIFAPGFSTSEVVSDLSGRGVGMDVVKTAVEKVNGSITLQSTCGKGTLIRLSLPLSMAVTNVMIVESDGQDFGIPMESVLETVRVRRSDIRTIKNAQTTVLRGKIIPLKSVNALLALAAPPIANDEDELAVLVVRYGQESVGLVVDRFKESIDIILKPLSGVLANLSVYSGSAMMGDGSVLMVINVKEIFGGY